MFSGRRFVYRARNDGVPVAIVDRHPPVIGRLHLPRSDTAHRKLEVQSGLEAELNKPLDPADVSRAATTPEMAAEMYLASVLIVDEEHFMERAYLDELARQLKLDPALKTELEQKQKD